MDRLKHLVNEAIEVLECDLMYELKKAGCCHGEVHDCIIHEIRETVDALEDCICIKHYCGWLKEPCHNPYPAQ